MHAQIILFAACLLLPDGARAQRNAPAEEQCFELGSHAESRACLEVLARQSADEVKLAEIALRAALQRWDQEPEHRSRSLAALRASSLSFARHRQAQCEFLSSLAAGGNGADDRRLLCQIELGQRRVSELRAALASLR
jgi:uncharacterized protein YecT (DUF1311 family)